MYLPAHYPKALMVWLFVLCPAVVITIPIICSSHARITCINYHANAHYERVPFTFKVCRTLSAARVTKTPMPLFSGVITVTEQKGRATMSKNEADWKSGTLRCIDTRHFLQCRRTKDLEHPKLGYHKYLLIRYLNLKLVNHIETWHVQHFVVTESLGC